MLFAIADALTYDSCPNFFNIDLADNKIDQRLLDQIKYLLEKNKTRLKSPVVVYQHLSQSFLRNRLSYHNKDEKIYFFVGL